MLAQVTFMVVLGTSWFMTGLIWFVQVVHYPLFSQVGANAFQRYETLHTMRTGWVVAPVMLLELGSTCLLLIARPPRITLIHASILVGLTVLIWAATFFIQVPLHGKLLEAGGETTIKRLVTSNWIRTISWTLKSLLCTWLLYQLTLTEKAIHP